MTRCTLHENPLPLGWGDHVRWMHEQDVELVRGAGPRHVLARREAAAIRSRAYAKLETAWRLARGAHPVERYWGMPTPPPIVDRHYGHVDGFITVCGYLVPERRHRVFKFRDPSESRGGTVAASDSDAQKEVVQ